MEKRKTENLLTISFLHFIIWLHFKGIYCLKDMKMKVPEAVKIGESTTLTCDYDLESVALYTIKWYKNEEEFYRYVPKESPPSRVFIIPHLNVDVSRSNSKEVTLTDVERETSGVFKCEVSADGPLFQTDMRYARLLVAEIPEEEPVLRTDMLKMTPGSKFTANCTTPGSYPYMNVTWFVNDFQVEEKFGIQIQNSIVHYDALPGLETVRSAITVNSTDLFRNGRMRIRCLATMFNLYRKSKEVEIVEDAPQIAPIRESSTYNSEGYFGKGSRPITQHPAICLLVMIFLHLCFRKVFNL